MNAILTPEQQRRVEMIRAWTGFFRRLTKKYESKWWRFGRPTLQLVKAIKDSNEADIARLWRYYTVGEYSMFWAINSRERKVIQVECQTPNLDTDLAYTDRWDPDYVNFPYLTFVGLYKPESFAEFELLFGEFLRAKTAEEIQQFEIFVVRRYQPHLLHHYDRQTGNSDVV